MTGPLTNITRIAVYHDDKSAKPPTEAELNGAIAYLTSLRLAGLRAETYSYWMDIVRDVELKIAARARAARHG